MDRPDLPDVPVITSIIDDNGSGNIDVKGTSSDDTTPTISGTGPENSTITLYMNGVEIATIGLGAGQTTWSYTVPGLNALAEGTYNFTATATVGPATSGLSAAATVTIDLTAPNIPAIGAVTDDVGPGTGPLTSSQITNDSQPTLTGNATA